MNRQSAATQVCEKQMHAPSVKKTRKTKAEVPADYQRMLTREILRTEILRVKTIIATATILAVGSLLLYAGSPELIQEVWRGQFRITYVIFGYLAFIGFEINCARVGYPPA